MRDILLEGGWPMFPILLFGLTCLILSIRHAALPQRSLVPLIVGAGAAALLFGLFGTTIGLQRAIFAVRDVPPEQRWIWVVGLGEALHDVGAAAALCLLAAPAAAIGSYRMSRRLESVA